MSDRQKLGIRINPLDVFLFGDGRPFEPGGQATSVLPKPQTTTGALTGKILRLYNCDVRELSKSIRSGVSFEESLKKVCPPAAWVARLAVRGPWLARINQGGNVEPLIPAPANLMKEKNADNDTFYRLGPLAEDAKLPGWNRPDRPLWHRSAVSGKAAAGYLTMNGVKKFLNNEVPSADDFIEAQDLYGFDRRVGIGISADTQSTIEGKIYGAAFLSLKPNVCFYAEMILPDDADRKIVPDSFEFHWGGEAKRALAEIITPYAWPKADKAGDGTLLLATTPAFTGVGVPANLKDYCVAVAVPGSQAVSGWDLAKGGPKPTRFAVEAGSTFFVKSDCPEIESLTENAEDARQGWGCFLKGVWTYV